VLSAGSVTHRCDLGTSLALLLARNTFLNLFLHSIGPLVVLHLMNLDILMFSTMKVLLEILDLRPSTMRVSSM